MAQSLTERILSRMRKGTKYNIKRLAADFDVPYRQVWTAMYRLEKRGLVKRVTNRQDGFREKV